MRAPTTDQITAAIEALRRAASADPIAGLRRVAERNGARIETLPDGSHVVWRPIGRGSP